jgi:hypothetical protein
VGGHCAVHILPLVLLLLLAPHMHQSSKNVAATIAMLHTVLCFVLTAANKVVDITLMSISTIILSNKPLKSVDVSQSYYFKVFIIID